MAIRTLPATILIPLAFLAGCHQEPKPQTRGAKVTVSAQELSDAYERNAVSAAARYAGHVVEVSGDLISVEPSSDAIASIQLSTSGDWPVTATITAASSRAINQLAKGQYVTVVCQDLERVSGALQLGGCRPTHAVDL